ncbi:DNA-binding domain-containing protein [Paucibacter sp. PLA-PC-4]|uniref:HvfC/BufC N-terminal domain-containing protein n=1 Tax=Paucibacter sp. PLA-PC-4 TaxID=2993655 RepID=UPI002248FF75|nr:DNA-binding domain-containing protein [Paucibacter sp. PLA-PC-4]MCX2861792.1 DNA-binding domain-containing protein [Paucibacter sp. PLA-PC-4]
MSRAAELRRQHALVQALLQTLPPAAPPLGLQALGGVTPTRGLQAYRGHAKALSAQTLASVFHRLQQALGETDFAAMAWAFWRACPPQRGDLGCWGQALPEFLRDQPDMPAWLPDLARLEWAAHQAERALDAELDAASLQWLAEQDPTLLSLRLRPGLHVLSLVGAAVARWPLAVFGSDDEDLIVLVWRLGWRAEARLLAADQAMFMQALLLGHSLQQSIDQTLAVHPGFDFAAWLQAALSEAWLQAVIPFKEPS